MPPRPFAVGTIQLAVVGAIVATLCDANHVLTGTLSYPEPFIFGQAAFAFPGFVAAFTVMALTYHYVTRLFPKFITRETSMNSGTAEAFVENLLFFAMVYLMSGFGNHHPVLLAAIFFASFFFRLAFTYDRAFILVLACLLGMGGMFVEGAMTTFDLVHYREPEIFGVPYWLGGVYMHGAFALRGSMRWFVYR